jgi:hypothetical protein
MIPVEGRVVSAHRVGLGLVHETASLEIEFLKILPQQHSPIVISGRVEFADNTREAIKNGTMHGIRSTESPQGQISSRLKYLPSIHLYPDPFLLGFKLLFPVFPEPEINLAAGTDLRVSLRDAVDVPSGLTPVVITPELSEEEQRAATDMLSHISARTVDRKEREADVIDVGFLGSEQQLSQAFRASGWKKSESVSKRTVAHQLHAFLAQTNYATAPISHQYYDSHPSDLNLEKTGNSYDKRNHLRIWKLGSVDGDNLLWAGAAVRETGATLSLNKGFIHHVDADLAAEREAILRDLTAAGCVDSVSLLNGSGEAGVMLNSTGELLRSDGKVMVVHLKTCKGDAETAETSNAAAFKPGSKFFRYVRKEILTVRSDLLRANCIYALFDLTKITAKSVQHNSAHRAEIKALGLRPGVAEVPPIAATKADARRVEPANSDSILPLSVLP